MTVVCFNFVLFSFCPAAVSGPLCRGWRGRSGRKGQRAFNEQLEVHEVLVCSYGLYRSTDLSVLVLLYGIIVFNMKLLVVMQRQVLTVTVKLISCSSRLGHLGVGGWSWQTTQWPLVVSLMCATASVSQRNVLTFILMKVKMFLCLKPVTDRLWLGVCSRFVHVLLHVKHLWNRFIFSDHFYSCLSSV